MRLAIAEKEHEVLNVRFGNESVAFLACCTKNGRYGTSSVSFRNPLVRDILASAVLPCYEFEVGLGILGNRRAFCRL